MDNLNEIYIDQSPYQSQFYDRCFSSVYTPHGIKTIESNFIARILNINNRVKKVFKIERRPKKFFSVWPPYEEIESMNYETHYDQLTPMI